MRTTLLFYSAKCQTERLDWILPVKQVNTLVNLHHNLNQFKVDDESHRGLAVKERVGLFVTPHTSRTAHYIILNEFRTAYLSHRNATRLVFLLFLRNTYTTKYNTCVIETRTLLYTIIETTLSNVLRKVSKLKCFIHNANTFT